MASKERKRKALAVLSSEGEQARARAREWFGSLSRDQKLEANAFIHQTFADPRIATMAMLASLAFGELCEAGLRAELEGETNAQ